MKNKNKQNNHEFRSDNTTQRFQPFIFQQHHRKYLREVVNNAYQRRVIIPLKEISIKQIDLNNLKQPELTEEQKKLNQEYSLERMVKSSFIIRNLAKKIQQNVMVWIQQDFDCFLSEFSLENLNFQKRIKIFYCIAHGIRDLHQKLVVHGCLSPNSISIIIKSYGEIKGKINCLQGAIILKNLKSRSQKPQTFINAFSAPQIKNKGSYGMVADIWSLGCVLNYILYQTIQNIWQENNIIQIQVPNGTPDWLLQLLRSLLHFDQKKRYCIKTIIDILKISQKCLEALGKYIPVGKKSLGLQKIPSKLSFEQNL